MRWLTFLVSISLLLSACRPTVSPTPEIPKAVSPLTGESFRLWLGGSTIIKNENLIVIFENILEDSRCPENVTCAWSGEAKVSILLSQSGEQPQRIELSSLPEKNRASVLDYVVELRAIEPYPKEAGKEITPSHYVITLVIFSR